jgi:hypothetical protein
VDFKTLQGISHYDNTSTTAGATREKRQRAVNKEYHDRTEKLDFELHGKQQDQGGPFQRAKSMSTVVAAVFLPPSLADTGVQKSKRGFSELFFVYGTGVRY